MNGVKQPEPAENAYPRLLADWGGTSLRFGYLASPTDTLAVITVPHIFGLLSPEELIHRFLHLQQLSMPQYISISIACPCDGDRISMPSHRWSFSVEALRQTLGVRELIFTNDGAAFALGLMGLPAAEMQQVGGGQILRDRPKVGISVGTGLAVGRLERAPNGDWFGRSGEGGRVSLSAVDDGEAELIRWWRRQPEYEGEVWAGLPLCGPGLVRLYEGVIRRRSDDPPYKPEDITRLGLSGEDPACAIALAYFFSFLGTFAGDLALDCNAGAVFINGGVIRAVGVDAVRRSLFRKRFEKRREEDRELLVPVPVFVVDSSIPRTFQGASVALDLALRYPR